MRIFFKDKTPCEFIRYGRSDIQMTNGAKCQYRRVEDFIDGIVENIVIYEMIWVIQNFCFNLQCVLQILIDLILHVQ